MTVCTYISPYKNPAISTDIVVTYDNVPSISRPGETIFSTDQRMRSFTHTRKNFILSERTCVSVAGNESKIYDFLKECRENLHIYEMNSRPAGLIGRMADQIGGLETISSHVDIHLNENHCSPINSAIAFNNMNLGVCKIVGSGRKRVQKFISEFKYIRKADYIKNGGTYVISDDGTIKLNFDTSLSDALEAISFTRGFFSTLSSKFLFLDIFGYLKGSNYGGFTEYSFFHPFKKKWLRQDSQVFFFYLLKNNGSAVEVSIINRVFAYHPGIDHGSIMSMGDNSTTFHRLRNIISEEPLPTLDIFNDYTPKYATVAFIGERRNGSKYFIGSLSTEPNEASEIIFDRQNGIFGMRDSWLSRYYESFIRAYSHHIG